MEIKRCYDTLIGASVAENQLCNGESVTVPNGRKYYLKKSGVESLGASAGSAITGLTSGSDMVIDLSCLLGSAIADYAYSLEQATAGSGIAWLRSYDLITDEYKPYNTGTIESVEATAKVVRDENNENAVTYPLGSDTLRGIFKLDANNQLYADGDRKEADGTITRRYKMIDLGTLAFNDYNLPLHIFRAELNDAKMSSIVQSQQNAPVNALMSNGYQVMEFTPISSNDDKCFAIGFRANGDKRLIIIDHDYDSISAFTQAMSGVYLVYELETPTTEPSTSFTSPQIVYPDGTEEFVTENGVPVGHETKYQL